MGFNTKNPRTAMRSGNQKLKEVLAGKLFEWEWAIKTQYIRLHGPIIAYEEYWFDIITDKGEVTSIPKMCIDLDPYTDDYISDDCPFRASGQGRQSRFYLVNGIWRKEQDNEPRKLPPVMKSEEKLRKIVSKCKEFPDGWEAYQLDLASGSESWTPNYLFKFTANQAAGLGDMAKENSTKGVAYDVTDVDFGCDIAIKHDPKGSGTGRYSILRDGDSGVTAMTDQELDYLAIKPDVYKLQTPADAEKEWKDLKPKLASDSDKKRNEDKAGRGRNSASRLDDDAGDDTPQRGRGNKDDDGDTGGRGGRGAVSARSGSGRFSRGSAGKGGGRSGRGDEDIPY